MPGRRSWAGQLRHGWRDSANWTSHSKPDHSFVETLTYLASAVMAFIRRKVAHESFDIWNCAHKNNFGEAINGAREVGLHSQANAMARQAKVAADKVPYQPTKQTMNVISYIAVASMCESGRQWQGLGVGASTSPSCYSVWTGACENGQQWQQWQQASCENASSATVLEAARRNQLEYERQSVLVASVQPDVISYSTGARSGENGQKWQRASNGWRHELQY
ncbi:unnamed protein product [Prorocentrum cordatum]|uniref:Uncharacterized protein n=1 Tax=Prorocentrum cordatum TaxID=2364126 RepID=A0ABN9X3Y1_9DINO|nr:unnamed protein product [Polarella glacialis]